MSALSRSARALALAALDDDELERIGRRYDARGPRHPIADDERNARDAALPAPPARVVTDCAASATELRARGYNVAMVHARAARPLLAQLLALAAGGAVVDAVILRRLERVLSDDGRLAWLQASVRLCPRGPVLITVAHVRHSGGGGGSARAARIGRALGALRGLGNARPGGRAFDVDGPRRELARADIDALARRAGFHSVTWSAAGCGAVAHAHAARGASNAAGAHKVRDDVVLDLLVDVLKRNSAYATIIARGGSMTPAIAHASRVRLERAPTTTTLCIGDVVAARVGGELRIHRIVGMNAARDLLLKGDASNEPDGWIHPDDILAVAAGVPAPGRLPARWRRALGRFRRAAAALRGP